MSNLISVIVPVYKAESYLDQCVQSIVDQTYRNLEIILVDDGSPDNCPAMCDTWAQKDDRIKVIHKKNGGGGDARNVALDIVSGEFVGMVDSDDYISPTMYEHLLGLMKDNIDIAECEILLTENDHAALEDGSKANTRRYTPEEAMRLHIQDTLFRQTPPNKLYRHRVVASARFPVGTRIDDEFWTYQTIGKSRALVHSTCPMYAYRQQASSVMHLSFALPRLQAIDAKCQRLEFLSKYYPQLVTEARINLQYTCFYMGQMSLKYMESQERTEAFKKLQAALERNSPSTADCRSLGMQQRIWFRMAKTSFYHTCQLRNLLKIGI